MYLGCPIAVEEAVLIFHACNLLILIACTVANHLKL